MEYSSQKIAPVDRKVYSIAEFCRAHGFCRASYYKLKKINKAPAEIKVGTRRLISEESANEWRRSMEAA
jgi:hypothetical protein